MAGSRDYLSTLVAARVLSLMHRDVHTLHRPGAFIGDMIGDVLRVSRVCQDVCECDTE